MTYDIAHGGVPMAGDGFLEVVAATQVLSAVRGAWVS